MSESWHHELPVAPTAGAERIRYLFSGSPMRAVHVDRAVMRLWGVPAEAIYSDPERFVAGVHAEDRQRLIDAWRSPHSKRWDLVYRVVRPDGDTTWVRDQGFALMVGTPPVRQISGRVEDVTEQHEVQERLRFHAQLLDAVSQAVVSTGLDDVVTAWNRGAERLYGWSAQEAVGRPLAELLGGTASRKQFETAWRESLARGGETRGEYFVRTKDGREILVETQATPLRDSRGRVIGRVGVSSDISARKDAERRLRESEERFRAIFQESGIGSAIVDLDGHVVIANQALASFLRCDTHELVGASMRALSHPQDWEKQEHDLRRLLAGEIDRYEREKRYRRSDGDFVWGRLTVTLVRDEHWVPLYVVAMVEDVDDRRRAEADLRASREELRRLYAHVQVVREMEQTRIARDLHDELGQMLTALKLDVAWLRSRANTAAGLQREEAVERLEQTTALVDQTLAATRRLAMHLRPVVLDDLGLEAALEWLVEEIGRSAGFQWQLHLRLDDLRPSGPRDTAAYRIVQEALTNVARHAGAKNVVLRVVHRDRSLVVSVRDDGRGLPQGAGRGIASMGIVGMRERARALGGELSVRRPRGGGTLVHARLPDPSSEEPQGEGKAP